jgi:N-acetylglucosaminyl-diphospho-decaprenol L-rhamnosyltransferase
MAGPQSVSETPFLASRLRRLPAVPRSAAPTAAISVVIVNFCQWKNTARLIRQLRHSELMKSGGAQVVVVDNGSPHHSAVLRLQKMRGVRIVYAGRNLGFATGVNRGVASSDGEWILLLNPDVTVGDGFLDDALLAAEKLIRKRPATGIVGLKLENRDGSTQPSCGPLPTLANTLAGIFSPRWKRKCRPLPDGEQARVPWATGGCLLVHRDCFRMLGGFDERFFLYYEDVDLCKRATQAGFEVWFVPSASAVHHWPLHSRPVPAPLRLITRHALLTFARNYWPKWQSWCLGRIIRLEARLRAAWAARAGNPGAAKFYRAMRKLVSDVECGRNEEVSESIAAAAEHLAAVAAAQDGRTRW